MTGFEKPLQLASIVIPAFNEQDTLEATVRSLVQVLMTAECAVEIVIVDDGSSDGTSGVIERLQQEMGQVRGVGNVGKHGYGYAVRKGLEAARGDALVVVMADGSDAPGDVAEYLRLIGTGYDCAFGSRFSGQSKVDGYPKLKQLVNRIGNWTIGKLTHSSYDDFTNGFKAYRRHVIEEMTPLRSGQFNLTVEMSIRAIQSGATVAVAPTDWRQRDAGVSSFRIVRQSILYLLTVVWVLTGARWLIPIVERPARVD